MTESKRCWFAIDYILLTDVLVFFKKINRCDCFLFPYLTYTMPKILSYTFPFHKHKLVCKWCQKGLSYNVVHKVWVFRPLNFKWLMPRWENPHFKCTEKLKWLFISKLLISLIICCVRKFPYNIVTRYSNNAVRIM